jgi:hypothetical protein
MISDSEFSALVAPYSWGKKSTLKQISKDTLVLREIKT